MKNVHFILQARNGIGKSFVASLITQYLLSKGESITAIDTDQMNHTLADYNAFNVRIINLLDGGVIGHNLDKLIEQILTEHTNFIIDNGAFIFVPLASYLIENESIKLISDYGKQVFIHIIVTGGQTMLDTLLGLDVLVKDMSEEAMIVVWLNEFFGDIVHDGKKFEEMKVYLDNRHRIHGIVTIDRHTDSTFGKDIQKMLDSRKTFGDVAASAKFGIMTKSRLNQVKQRIFDQLDLII